MDFQNLKESPGSGDDGLILEIQSLSKRFGAAEVLREISLRLHRGRTLVILGPSGCGKTTLLKLVAGLLPPSSGTLRISGKSITASSGDQRNALYLDQEPLLFEHLNVFENAAFPMRMRGCSAEEIQSRVSRMLDAVGLAEHSRKRSWELSGGQKQRVAFARAILAEPQLLLLDEPFGSLDNQSRAQMQELFIQLREQYRFTSVFVTHDVREAVVVGEVFSRMECGRLFVHADRISFVTDPGTGIPGEVEFWRTIHSSDL